MASSWRALALLASAMVLSMSTWFSASAVLPALRERWSLQSVEASFLTIAVQLGFVVGAILSSVTNVSDIVPARRVFFVSSLGAAIANALVIVADDLGMAVVARSATGLFAAGVYPPAMKVMSTHFRTGRGVALGVMVATNWLVPVLRDGFGWWAAFAALAPGPFLGAVAMLALKGRPETARIAGGRGQPR